MAEDGAEVARLCAALDEAEARRIGAAARRRLLAEHTYAQRALAVEDALARAAAGREPAARGKVA